MWYPLYIHGGYQKQICKNEPVIGCSFALIKPLHAIESSFLNFLLSCSTKKNIFLKQIKINSIKFESFSKQSCQKNNCCITKIKTINFYQSKNHKNSDLPFGLVNRGLVSFRMNESFSNSFLSFLNFRFFIFPILSYYESLN